MEKKSYLDAYNKGVELKDTDITTIVYSGLVPDYFFFDFTISFFFECGYQGYDFPEYVQGWRYGNVPESGRSYNYRDQKPEHGVSIMGLGEDVSVADRVSTLFIACDNRPIVKIEGYLNPYKHGSDGEYLLVDAKEIKED